MSLAAGALSQVSVTSTGAVLNSAAASGGTAPYSYQWYRSTTNGFSPGAGSLISGATALSLTDSALVPNSTYYYKVVVTDSASPAPATATSSQLAVTTLATTPAQNSFSMAAVVGQLDMPFNMNSMSAVIDPSQSGTLYQGMAVKIVTSVANGLPSVVACSSNQDEVFGFINYNQKNVGYVAGNACEISQAGNVMWLYATTAITRGTKVCLDVSQSAAVQAAGNASPAADVVGWALDGAAAAGTLIRVRLTNPSFLTA